MPTKSRFSILKIRKFKSLAFKKNEKTIERLIKKESFAWKLLDVVLRWLVKFEGPEKEKNFKGF